ncbi:MAG TPA: cysteine-rich CWC family protein [Gammaproteobacteria bacterium]|nr:cysteine-rich CWC family protein [Gammaproteobacteria bacterium]
MTAAGAKLDRARCPLCGEPNACALAAGSTPCWCSSVAFPATVIAAVSDDAKNEACVCRACVEAQ